MRICDSKNTRRYLLSSSSKLITFILINRLVENGGTQYTVGAKRNWWPEIVDTTHWLLAVRRHVDVAHNFQLQFGHEKSVHFPIFQFSAKSKRCQNESEMQYARAIKVWNLIDLAHLLVRDGKRACHHDPRDALTAGRRRKRSGVRVIVVFLHCVRVMSQSQGNTYTQ